jgi:hypothetical protein
MESNDKRKLRINTSIRGKRSAEERGNIFSSGQKRRLDALLAQLSVLYEDLRIELAGLAKTTCPTSTSSTPRTRMKCNQSERASIVGIIFYAA